MEGNNEITEPVAPSPKKEKWILWQVEDMVAQRWSPVFCSPTKEVIVREMARMLEDKKASKVEFRVEIVGVLDGENLFEMREMVLL